MPLDVMGEARQRSLTPPFQSRLRLVPRSSEPQSGSISRMHRRSWPSWKSGESLWIGTLGGLFRYDVASGTTRSYTKASSGLPSNLITGLATDPAGRIWVATKSSGVACFDGRSWVTYRTALTKNDLSQPSSILAGPDGQVWVGTRNGFLFGYDGKMWQQYDARTDLMAAWPAITALGLDDDGTLLAGTSWGLGRLVGTGLQEVAGVPQGFAQPHAIRRDTGRTAVARGRVRRCPTTGRELEPHLV